MNELSFILVVTGPLLMIVAFIWRRFPPANINYLYGYRTASSMKNENTWKEANVFAARLLLKIAAVLAVLGALFSFVPVHGMVGTVTGLGLVICGLAFLIWRTEKHLWDVFDENGERRNMNS